MSIDPHILEFYWMCIQLEAVPKEHTEVAQRVTLWQGRSRLIPRGLQLQKASVSQVINLG